MRIPIGETVNGLKIIGRAPAHKYSYKILYLVECMCGAKLLKEEKYIRNGSILPCFECRKKIGLKV